MDSKLNDEMTYHLKIWEKFYGNKKEPLIIKNYYKNYNKIQEEINLLIDTILNIKDDNNKGLYTIIGEHYRKLIYNFTEIKLPKKSSYMNSHIELFQSSNINEFITNNICNCIKNKSISELRKIYNYCIKINYVNKNIENEDILRIMILLRNSVKIIYDTKIYIEEEKNKLLQKYIEIKNEITELECTPGGPEFTKAKERFKNNTKKQLEEIKNNINDIA